jgi:hypothetical protein
MQRLEVSGALHHVYIYIHIYVVSRQSVKNAYRNLIRKPEFEVIWDICIYKKLI